MLLRPLLLVLLLVVPFALSAGEAATDPNERVFFRGRWVTREAQGNMEKGLILSQGKWVPEEEMYKAKGWVKYHGTWISPQRLKTIQARQVQVRERIKFASDWKNAWELKTEHFVIKSNVSPQLITDLGKAMEQCFAELANVFSAKTKLKNIPIDVFATQEQFIRNSAESGFPSSSNTLGYFWWRGDESGIRCFYTGTPEQTMSTLFHECSHLVLHSVCGDNPVPTWANEGLAVFFESAERDDKSMKLQTIPFDRLWHLKRMMKEGDLSLNQLCTLSGVREYSVDYYPQGWSLIYYMLYADNGKYRTAFNGFFQMMTKGKFEGDGVGMFKKGFGRAPDEFKPEWQKYFEALEPKTTAEFAAAATAAYTRWLDFESALAFAESALKGMKGKDDKVLLCNARLHLTLGRWEFEPKRKSEEYGKAIDFFEQVFPPTKEGAKPAVVPKAKLTPQYATDRLDYAKACIGGGRYEQAQDVIDDLLSKKEYEFNADAYSAYALLSVVAEDPAYRDLVAAKENVAIAEDLGADQDNKYVQALIAIAEDRKDKAAKYLSEAASRDQFGFGGRFYRRELMRLVRPVKVAEPGEGEAEPGPNPDPKLKPKSKE